ncbi:MAG: RNase adapter RapZ [Thermodesulfovibrionales bacterium]|nr:RNase adapter RapZ [Thermodesulfovibrionales bacterium]
MKLKPTIVIITGLSGSGKTVALRALEDSGFFCVDNLPVTLIKLFVSRLPKKDNIIKIGVGIDIREHAFLSSMNSALRLLKKKYRTEIVFLEAEKGVLVRRFKETRRPHPLSPCSANLDASIEKEKGMLLPLRREADRIIDTSSYTPHQLRQLITSLYSNTMKSNAMSLTFISFGYKFGVPQNIDLLFDVRFIPNPNFIPELKELRGIDPPVKKFIFEKPQTKQFIKKLKELLNFLIPLYIKEGKAYLTVGIGCTGGRHRSPAITEKIAALIEKHPVEISAIHRDL